MRRNANKIGGEAITKFATRQSHRDTGDLKTRKKTSTNLIESLEKYKYLYKKVAKILAIKMALRREKYIIMVIKRNLIRCKATYIILQVRTKIFVCI